MKLKSVTIQNFRCCKEPRTIEFENLTTLIGKNDIGKSTILEALEIFFNNDIVKIAPEDLNNHAEKMVWPKCKDNTSKYYLSAVFDQKMTIDYLEVIDTKGEVKGWFEKITKMVNKN